nr:MAG: hypothetical protein DIU52_15710 [bacterium]
MFVLLLGAALIQADSTYASPALREAIARAAESNREAPAEPRSYRALVETEAALVIHTPERAGHPEQSAGLPVQGVRRRPRHRLEERSTKRPGL